MNVAESGSAGRARSATTETKNARAKVLFRERPLPEPVDDPDLLDWTNPGTRIRLINALMADPGPFSFLRRRAVAVLEVLINRRNPHTGQLDPSWLNLGAGARYKDRSVAYALSELRRNGLIASVRRCYGLRPTSCAYVLTCTLLVLAGLVKEHDPGTCAKCRSAAALNAGPRLHNLQTNRDLLFPSGISSSADPTRSKKGRGEPRRVRAGIRPPFSKGSGAEESSDPAFTAFLAVFQRERHTAYDDNDHGTIGAENRAKLSAFLAGFVGSAWAWSEQQGLERERADVAEELFEGLARTWLSMPGTNGFVRERRHPLGLLIGDLDEFGDLARHAWERKQTKPKPLEEHEAPAGAVSAAGYVEQLQEREHEEWPDLDDSEPDADELAELDALRVVAAQVPATVEPSRAAIGAEPPPGDRLLLASIHAAMERRAALAARKDAAKVQIAAAFPESIRKTAYGEPPPSPARLTNAAPEPTVDAPRKHRESTEATEGPTTGPEAPQEAAEGPRPPRIRRPGSRPFAGTTSAPGGRPDAWRPLARPKARTGDEPPDE
ncbi:MAG: hypothetical protein ACMG6S_17530 [Byssovorax sp.]